MNLHICADCAKRKLQGPKGPIPFFNLDFCFGAVAGSRKKPAPLGRFRDFWAPSRV
jgi:hypothetical protein